MSSVTVSLRRHASRFGSENKAYTCIQDVPQGTGAPRRCPKPAPSSRLLRILHNYFHWAHLWASLPRGSASALRKKPGAATLN